MAAHGQKLTPVAKQGTHLRQRPYLCLIQSVPDKEHGCSVCHDQGALLYVCVYVCVWMVMHMVSR